MSDHTSIEWATATWNPMTGCTPVSEACEHCYAERMAQRFGKNADCPACGGQGEITQGHGWLPCPMCHGSHQSPFWPTFHPDRLDVPLHWRKPRRIFVCSMSDLFHEAFTDEQISRVFNVMWRGAPQHTYLVLTKRPERMREYVTREWVFKQPTRAEGVLPLPNLWLGVTVENQARADERIPILLDTPAAVRFVSVEPMLGPVELTKAVPGCRESGGRLWWPGGGERHLDWVILGGETGPGARPMQPEWALDVYRQCKAAGVPFFFKQWGGWASKKVFPDQGLHICEMEGTREFPEGVGT